MLKESILFEGTVGDDINDVIPIVIRRAKELKEDVFIRWNSTTVRVSPNSTVNEVLKNYNDELHLISLKIMENNGELITKDQIANKISSLVINFLNEKL